MKEKIIGVCIVIGIIMTLFPPQQILEYRYYRDQPYETVEYRFIGDGGYSSETTSIAFDRLLLQYVILVGAGFAFYLLRGKKEEQSQDE